MTPEEQAALDGEARAVEGEYIAAEEVRAQGGAEESAAVSTAALLALLLKPTFDVLAPAWAVSEPECRLLAEAYGAVLDKYLPDLDLGVEAAAVIATFAVFGPRWGKPRAAVKPARAAAPSTPPPFDPAEAEQIG